jgi:hypothetical protein
MTVGPHTCTELMLGWRLALKLLKLSRFYNETKAC